MECDTCSNYVYDEDDESYACMVNLDEDEMYHFLTRKNKSCPYYRGDDEYKVVRHQMWYALVKCTRDKNELPNEFLINCLVDKCIKFA